MISGIVGLFVHLLVEVPLARLFSKLFSEHAKEGDVILQRLSLAYYNRNYSVGGTGRADSMYDYSNADDGPSMRWQKKHKKPLPPPPVLNVN